MSANWQRSTCVWVVAHDLRRGACGQVDYMGDIQRLQHDAELSRLCGSAPGAGRERAACVAWSNPRLAPSGNWRPSQVCGAAGASTVVDRPWGDGREDYVRTVAAQWLARRGNSADGPEAGMIAWHACSPPLVWRGGSVLHLSLRGTCLAGFMPSQDAEAAPLEWRGSWGDALRAA